MTMWYALGDDTVARRVSALTGQPEDRIIYCYAVIEESASPPSRLFSFAKELLEWRNRYEPNNGALPIANPRCFGDAAFVSPDRKTRLPQWNRECEPKWSSVFAAARGNLDFLQQASAHKLWAPVGELLSLTRNYVTLALVLDLPMNRAKDDALVWGEFLRLINDPAQLGTPRNPTAGRGCVFFDRHNELTRWRRVLELALDANRRGVWGVLRELVRCGAQPGRSRTAILGALAAQCLIRLRCWCQVSAAPYAQERWFAETALASTHICGTLISNQWAAPMASQDVGKWIGEQLQVLATGLEPVLGKEQAWRNETRTFCNHVASLSDGWLSRAVEGPHLLETHLSPLQMVPDFLAGLYSFFNYARHNLYGPAMPGGPIQLDVAACSPILDALGIPGTPGLSDQTLLEHVFGLPVRVGGA